ncbi:hypothetical protein [Parapedobacter koreensis]|uniref:Uncharacterized protein n=1 Tax=Parapedobacter koreensis TaxID=332977 RepID=A0A1H7GX01_9SPHI|nr:hypothetical protein [Parapedobacter koreensis]SEK41582.1 hypothetical protein SAMN05421740_101804 [Parapedobacter koreensis]
MAQQSTIEELEKLKAELLSKVHNIDQTIQLLKVMSNDTNDKLINRSNVVQLQDDSINSKDKELISRYKDYDKNATVKMKVVTVLKTENRFLHLRQIAKILHLLEPDTSEKDFVTKLYTAVSKLKSSGAIVKYAIGASNVNTFWGSKNWLDDKGEPKSEHKYDEDAVTKFNPEVIEI